MLIVILNYLTDVCKLSIVIFGILKLNVTKKIKTIIVIIGLSLLILAFVYKMTNENATYLGVIMAIVTINIITDKWSRFFIIFLCYLIISLIDLLSGGIVVLITQKSIDEILSQPILDQICNFPSLVILFAVFFILRKNRRIININHSLLGSITLGIIGTLLYIAPIQTLGIEMNESKYKLEIIIGVTLSGGILLFVYMALLIIYYKNSYYKENLQISQELLKAQKNYFHSILKKEEETKKFRHDITHHISCLLELQKADKYNDLKEYLLDMSNQIEKIKGNIDTGNDVINIILDDIYTNYSSNNIGINWNGYFPEKTKMSNMDICILFSNILKNAVEAEIKWGEQFTEQNDYDYKQNNIEVNIKNINHALYIIVTNDTIEQVKTDKNHAIYTTKVNKKGHGFGTKNIIDIVQKYGGTLTYTCTNYLFSTEVLFENII